MQFPSNRHRAGLAPRQTARIHTVAQGQPMEEPQIRSATAEKVLPRPLQGPRKGTPKIVPRSHIGRLPPESP